VAVCITLFGGWELAGIALLASGLPLNITVTRKTGICLRKYFQPASKSCFRRVDLPRSQTISNWLNPAAFSLPGQGPGDNLGKVSLAGPLPGIGNAAGFKPIRNSLMIGVNRHAEQDLDAGWSNFRQADPGFSPSQ